jgi:hypothetical protein
MSARQWNKLLYQCNLPVEPQTERRDRRRLRMTKTQVGSRKKAVEAESLIAPDAGGD